MEKRAVISEEDTPDLEQSNRPTPGTPEYAKTLPEYQQKIARILGSTPVKLEDLDENHPTRRLIAGAGFAKSAKPKLTQGDKRNKVK